MREPQRVIFVSTYLELVVEQYKKLKKSEDGMLEEALWCIFRDQMYYVDCVTHDGFDLIPIGALFYFNAQESERIHSLQNFLHFEVDENLTEIPSNITPKDATMILLQILKRPHGAIAVESKIVDTPVPGLSVYAVSPRFS